MDRRSAGVMVAWGGIGNGTVVKGIPPEDLHPPGTGNILGTTPSPSTQNIRLYDGLAQLRPGYVSYADVPTVSYPNPVTGLISVKFKTGDRYLLRLEASAVDPGGTHTAGTSATVMTDSTRNFVVDSLIGSTIRNLTDVPISSGVITDNDAQTVTVAALTGGSRNDWQLNDQYEISSDLGRVYRLDDTGSPFSWLDISGGTNLFSGGSTGYWSWAVAPIPGVTPNDEKMFFCNGTDAIYEWSGTGNVAAPSWTGQEPVAPKVLVSYLSRLIAMNYEDASGNRLQNALQYSVVGDATDWSGRGAGTINLSEDTYPIVNALVLGGRLCIWKGDDVGGSIVIGTPTGVSTNPIRLDTVQSVVGAIIPRSVVQIGESLAFFLGHDAFYLYDGARTLRPFAMELAREVVGNMNTARRESGFAVYHPQRREILLGYPRRGQRYPDEYWWVDPFTQRVYGPHYFDLDPSSAAFHIPSGSLTWDTLPGPDWTNLADSDGNPFGTWDDIIDPSGAGGYQLVFGFNDGTTFADNGENFKDNAVAVKGIWTSPALTPAGLSRRVNGQPVEMDPEDIMTLRGVTIRWKDYAAWTPIVEYSTDGGSNWTTISTGTQVGTGSERILSTTYRALKTGRWFQFRISNTSERWALHSVIVEITRSGSYRHT